MKEVTSKPLDPLAKRYVFKVIGGLVSASTTLFILSFVPRQIGVSAFGVYTLITQTFAQVANFFDFSVSGAILVKLSRDPRRMELKAFSISFLLLVFLLLTASLLIFLEVNQQFSVYGSEIMLLALVCFLIYASTFVSGMADALGDTSSAEVIKVSGKVFSLVALGFFTFNQSLSFLSFSFILTISQAAVLLFLCFRVFYRGESATGKKRLVQFLRPKKGLLTELYEFCSPLVVHSFISSLIVLFDIWVLRYVTDDEQVGFYGIALGFSQIAIVLVSSIVALLTREVSSASTQHNSARLHDLMLGFAFPFSLLLMIFSFFCSANAEFIARLVNEDSERLYPLLEVAFLVAIFQGLNQILTAISVGMGRSVVVRNATILGAVASTVLLPVMLVVLGYGVQGLFGKVLICTCLICGYQFFVITNAIKLKSQRVVALPALFSAGSILVIWYLSLTVGAFTSSPLFSLVSCGISYVGFCMLFCAVFRRKVAEYTRFIATVWR